MKSLFSRSPSYYLCGSNFKEEMFLAFAKTTVNIPLLYCIIKWHPLARSFGKD